MTTLFASPLQRSLNVSWTSLEPTSSYGQYTMSTVKRAFPSRVDTVVHAFYYHLNPMRVELHFSVRGRCESLLSSTNPLHFLCSAPFQSSSGTEIERIPLPLRVPCERSFPWIWRHSRGWEIMCFPERSRVPETIRHEGYQYPIKMDEEQTLPFWYTIRSGLDHE